MYYFSLICVLSLGFPFETTVAISRLITSGTLDHLPKLKLLIAHAGACLPGLIGRLDSCVEHDASLHQSLRRKPSDYLKNMYFDAISYGSHATKALIELAGHERIMFGTDNPFFPPLGADDVTKVSWPSTTKVYETLQQLPAVQREAIWGGNAKKILSL